MSQDDVTAQPWQFGDDDARWAGYLIPGTDVLRNKLGATWHEALRLHEDRLVEQRTIRLLAGEGPRIGYDFTGFQRVHEWLFQDVYEWAGQPRTVNMSKNGLSFLGVDELDEAFQMDPRDDVEQVDSQGRHRGRRPAETINTTQTATAA